MKAKEEERGSTDHALQDNADIVTDHNVLFDSLPLEERLALIDEAVVEAKVRQVMNAREAAALRGKLSVLQTRERERNDPRHGIPNTLSAMRLSEEAMARAADLWNSKTFRGDDRRRNWEHMMDPPFEPPPHLQEELLELEKAIVRETPVRPRHWWAKYISENRDRFEWCGLKFECEPAFLYAFLYAKQRPIYSVFLKCPVVGSVPDLALFGLAEPTGYDFWAHTWSWSDYTYTHDVCMPEAGDEQVWVYHDLAFEGNVLATRQEPKLFEDYLMGIPRPPRRLGQEQRDTGIIDPTVLDLLREEFPWLTDEDLGIGSGRHGAHGHGGHTGERPAVPRELTKAATAAEAAEIRARLLREREEWASGYVNTFFYVRILGGLWTHQHCKGRDSNAVTQFPREFVKRWCTTYKWPKQKGFYYTWHGGEENCHALAREWCRRGTFFYTIWMERGEDYGYPYSEEELKSCPEDGEFIDWACTINVDTPAFDAILEVRHAVPMNPHT